MEYKKGYNVNYYNTGIVIGADLLPKALLTSIIGKVVGVIYGDPKWLMVSEKRLLAQWSSSSGQAIPLTLNVKKVTA